MVGFEEVDLEVVLVLGRGTNKREGGRCVGVIGSIAYNSGQGKLFTRHVFTPFRRIDATALAWLHFAVAA